MYDSKMFFWFAFAMNSLPRLSPGERSSFRTPESQSSGGADASLCFGSNMGTFVDSKGLFASWQQRYATGNHWKSLKS